MAYTVQADYEQLTGISQRFNDQSDQVKAHFDKVSHQMETLKNGAWVGPNADKYYEIMESNLLPAMQRLIQGLSRASEVTQQVAKVIRDADEQNKSLFPQ